MEAILQYFSDNLVLGIVVVSATLVMFGLTILLALNSKKSIFIKETLEAREKSVVKADDKKETHIEETNGIGEEKISDEELDNEMKEIEKQIELTNQKSDEDLEEINNITNDIIGEDKDIDIFTNKMPGFDIGDGKLSEDDEKFINNLDDVEKINENDDIETEADEVEDEVTSLEKELENVEEEEPIEQVVDNEVDDYFESDEVKSFLVENNGEVKKETADEDKTEETETTEETDTETMEEKAEETVEESDDTISEEITEEETNKESDTEQEKEKGTKAETKYLVYFDSSINKWIVKKENADRVSKKLNDRQKAIEHVRVLISRYGGTYEVCRKNNKKDK